MKPQIQAINRARYEKKQLNLLVKYFTSKEIGVGNLDESTASGETLNSLAMSIYGLNQNIEEPIYRIAIQCGSELTKYCRTKAYLLTP